MADSNQEAGIIYNPLGWAYPLLPALSLLPRPKVSIDTPAMAQPAREKPQPASDRHGYAFFNDERTPPQPLRADFKAKIVAMVNAGDVEGAQRFANEMGQSLQHLDQMKRQVAQGTRYGDVVEGKGEMAPIDPGDGTLGAIARGAEDSIFLDKANALKGFIEATMTGPTTIFNSDERFADLAGKYTDLENSHSEYNKIFNPNARLVGEIGSDIVSTAFLPELKVGKLLPDTYKGLRSLGLSTRWARAGETALKYGAEAANSGVTSFHRNLIAQNGDVAKAATLAAADAAFAPSNAIGKKEFGSALKQAMPRNQLGKALVKAYPPAWGSSMSVMEGHLVEDALKRQSETAAAPEDKSRLRISPPTWNIAGPSPDQSPAKPMFRFDPPPADASLENKLNHIEAGLRSNGIMPAQRAPKLSDEVSVFIPDCFGRQPAPQPDLPTTVDSTAVAVKRMIDALGL